MIPTSVDTRIGRERESLIHARQLPLVHLFSTASGQDQLRLCVQRFGLHCGNLCGRYGSPRKVVLDNGLPDPIFHLARRGLGHLFLHQAGMEIANFGGGVTPPSHTQSYE